MKRIKNEEEGVVICKSDDSGRIGSVDCISQLPEDIIRHILFFMPAKDAAQTSNLSKTWQQAWNSLPICTFRFDEQFLEENSLLHVGKQKETEEERERFLSHVNESLSILREKKVVVECFQLDLPLCITFYAPYIDQWISLVTRNCVQELDIHVPSYDTCLRNFVSYTLPKTTFAAKSLFTLHLTGCKLVKELFSDDTKFLCLQQLSLVNVYLEDEVVQKLLSCCPSIHTFTLQHCRKLTFLQLCNLPKLKKVNVQGFISRMQVDLPRLQNLTLNISIGMQLSICSDHLKKLKLSVYKGIKNQSIQALISRLPALKSLELFVIYRLEIPTHHCLRRLSLKFSDIEPEDVKIDAPNLHWYNFSACQLPSLHFIKSLVYRKFISI